MRGPLHPQLAHLERAYLTIRNEVADGTIDESSASSILRSGAIADRDGNHWWVDFDSSSQTAEFFSNRTGSECLADPAEFRHSSPVAVPAVKGSSADAETAGRLFQETSSHVVTRIPTPAPATSDEGDSELSSRQAAARRLRKITDHNEEVSKAYTASQPAQPRTATSTPGSNKALFVIPAVVVAFLIAVALFGGSGSEEIAPPVSTAPPTTVVVEVAPTTTTLPPLVVDDSTGLVVLPPPTNS